MDRNDLKPDKCVWSRHENYTEAMYFTECGNSFEKFRFDRVCPYCKREIQYTDVMATLNHSPDLKYVQNRLV